MICRWNLMEEIFQSTFDFVQIYEKFWKPKFTFHRNSQVTCFRRLVNWKFTLEIQKCLARRAELTQIKSFLSCLTLHQFFSTFDWFHAVYVLNKKLVHFIVNKIIFTFLSNASDLFQNAIHKSMYSSWDDPNFASQSWDDPRSKFWGKHFKLTLNVTLF